MSTLRLVVRYDGAALSGWQRQRGVRTVQQELERVGSAMARHTVRVHGAGRTDAGVHALGQVASFVTTAQLPMKGWRLGMTQQLPPEIAVLDVREVRDDFDPRRASAGKRYRYLLQCSPVRDPLLRNRAWHVYQPLELAPMRAAAEKLLGWNDFAAFRAADCERTSTVRCLWRVAVLENFAGMPGLVAIEVEGTAFLKNMVRIVVGTLVDVGRGRFAPSHIDALLASGDRTKAGMTAPAFGLYLEQVFVRPEYRLDDDVLNLRPDYSDAYLFQKPALAASPAALDDE